MSPEEFIAYIAASKQYKRLFHFTDKRNLPSIKQRGLLATSELRRRGLFSSVTTGGDANSLASDTETGTDEFVCLCFTDSHPMVFIAANDERKLDAAYLEIDPQIITLPGVMVADAPSNQSGVVPLPVPEGLPNLDLDIIYRWHDWNLPEVQARLQPARKYELLVPKSIAVKYILKGL
jgi:hypothetical protein